MKKKFSKIEAQYASIKLFEQFCECSVGSIPSIQGHLNHFEVSLHVKNEKDLDCLCMKVSLDSFISEVHSFHLDRFDEYCICVLFYFDLE